MSVEADPNLLLQIDVAEENSKYWKKELEELRSQLAASAGEQESLTVNGREVYSYNRTAKLREGDLKKAEPQMYENFLVTQEVEVFDVERFKRIYPEVYREYQSRSLRRSAG